MVSRTSVANPSAPLRKSTGLVATITRTVPEGQISGSPPAPERLRQSCWRPRGGRPGSYPRRPQPRLSRYRAWTCIAALCADGEEQAPARSHPPPPAQTAILPLQNALPQIPLIGGASQTAAAATTHGVEPRHKPSHHSLRSLQQSATCLRLSTSADDRLR